MKIAEDALELAERDRDAGPLMSNMILGAVAYVDALTSAIAGKINQTDHQAAVQLLRGTLGNGLPKAQQTNLRALISIKDEVQYGATFEPIEDAETLMQRARSFADWAEAEMSRRFPKDMTTL
jgi:hypothetical protein